MRQRAGLRAKDLLPSRRAIPSWKGLVVGVVKNELDSWNWRDLLVGMMKNDLELVDLVF